MVEEQEEWQEAANYLLQAVDIYTGFDDRHNWGIVMRSLARVWQAAQASPDFDKKGILNRLATSLNITPAEALALLEQSNNDVS